MTPQGEQVVLHHILARTCPKRRCAQLGVVVAGDDADAHSWPVGREDPRGVEPVAAGHLDVHQHPVGAVGAEEEQPLGTVRALVNLRRHVGDDVSDHPPHVRVVVDDEDVSGIRMAAVFVPAAQTTPPAFQYIDRSTTMPTPLVTSTTAANEASASSGTSLLTWTL